MRAYFSSAIGYVFLAVFLLLSGLYFVVVNLSGGDGQMSSMMGSFAGVLFLLIPILTMRLMAEDRAQRTDQLLLTAPVSLTQIVVGKYLAACFVFFAASVATAPYLLILFLYGEPYWVEVLLAYLGLWLLGGAMIAVGQFISSLTERQLVAALLNLCVLFLLTSFDSLTASLQSRWLLEMLRFFAPLSYFDAFIINVFRPAALLYFLLFIGTFLFLTVQVMQGRRYGKG